MFSLPPPPGRSEATRRRPRGAGMADPMAIANELVGAYSFTFEEIRAVVIKEADAAGIPLVAR